MGEKGGQQMSFSFQLGLVKDKITVDITDLPADVRVETGTMAELIGETLAIHEVASAAGTIAYEVLTNLGQRYARSYTR